MNDSERSWKKSAPKRNLRNDTVQVFTERLEREESSCTNRLDDLCWQF